jgi:small GTP-binding protein
MKMPGSREIKLKICLIGEGAVGKTSLIKRFVYDAFEGDYITTLGTKVTKKEFEMNHPKNDDPVNLTILLWDIMGQKGFRELLQEAYFYGAQGLIAVCDLTNKETIGELEGWINAAFKVIGEVPIVFLANKSDLSDSAQFSLDELKEFASNYKDSSAYKSSAKTGENVDDAFAKLSTEILKK